MPLQAMPLGDTQPSMATVGETQAGNYKLINVNPTDVF